MTLVLRWSALLVGGAALELASPLAPVVWVALAVVSVVGELFRQRQVTIDMILGAIVAYLLSGVAFAYLYEVLALRPSPGSPGRDERVAERVAAPSHSRHDFCTYHRR